ncbi:serine/threonine-protein kinase [Streptomyces sp. TRM68367]|uniref:serine/threonine-protein kinase n=1 Tax=Streptomyces sp. TRM68367 TaxID=2758415 RepID=UPI00165AD8C2|nr:serine/threonine-protein kinase [Streptomyces sp. TRM68367]MBC9726416.1 protein kinase [Streptomyces sp. TRM68367]
MGEVFAGRYELVDPIGRGGVGAVWRAWDHRRRRYVAAKVLQQSDAHSLLRFVREQALRIDHPHVLAPASWAADDDKVLFTMDLIAGGSLAHVVGDYGPLPPAFVCTLLDQLLAGLAAVHAEGVVHRDIKPANVLLEATGTGRPRLRLSDFGIAMRLGEPRLTETNLVVGTPGYLAPEQMMGAEPDFPADLFAVGLVALYLLEGAKPDAKALIQYFAAHGTPNAPQGIPEPLWQVVATLLQPDPQARFRTATGARKALAAAAELLPEPGPDDELIEIFDQLGPLPSGFAPDGPLKRAPGLEPRTETSAGAAGAAEASGSEAVGPPDGRGEPSPPGGSDVPSGSGAGVVPAERTGTTSTTHTADPRQGGGRVEASPVPAPPVSMSDTGSFHLPPPRTGEPATPPPVPQAPREERQGRTRGARTPAQPYAQARAPHHAQSQAQTPQSIPQQPALVSPYDSTHVLSPKPYHPQTPSPQPHPAQAPTPTPYQHADASTASSTASYTAQDPQVPPSAGAVSPSLAAPRSQPRRSRRRRRPGPPAKVAVPLLLLALACYAVGFWAWTQI